jgi:hypothetical protein
MVVQIHRAGAVARHPKWATNANYQPHKHASWHGWKHIFNELGLHGHFWDKLAKWLAANSGGEQERASSPSADGGKGAPQRGNGKGPAKHRRPPQGGAGAHQMSPDDIQKAVKQLEMMKTKLEAKLRQLDPDDKEGAFDIGTKLAKIGQLIGIFEQQLNKQAEPAEQ